MSLQRRTAVQPRDLSGLAWLAGAAALGVFMFGQSVAAQEYAAPPVHGIAMHGEPAYAADFTHFAYTNRDAPKGGSIVMESSGGFDNFNPFILRGTAAAGLGLVFETLLVASDDEPFTKYGLIAESLEVPEDRSWVAFNLNPAAKFHDGQPVTAEDVVWSFETLKEKGAPFYAFYWGDVSEVRATSPHRVLFVFGETSNLELPLILGQLPVLPKHFWDGRAFDEPLDTMPIGSGPYRVTGFEFGRRVAYTRDPDYWGADLAVSSGKNNADSITYEYFRDREVATEAFKAGAFDFRQENSSKRWATAYDFPGLTDGVVIKEVIPNDLSAGMQGLTFNIRKPIFQDRRVREAIVHAFDFEWANKTLMYDAYMRTESFFENTELASGGLPSAAELKLLEPLRDQLPAEVFTAEYKAPVTDGSGANRQNLRAALKFLRDAGWSLADGVMTKDGLKLAFEILITQGSAQERILNPFIANLEKIGVKVTLRLVDPAQYQNRLRDFDYDMIVGLWGQSLSPGNEQRDFWGSEAASRPGSRNYIGLQDPAIDRLIEHVVQADSREALITATRALDRALLWGHYVIPQFHSGTFRVIFWNKFGQPKVAPKYGLGFPSTWWVDPEKAAAVRAYQGKK
jgi:microcin C transport system substrate-binding protein